ncbi:hypothetical protein BGX26_010125 [Mortierella sp. AD094]|nr:hypothetical protein BGX26_010125 [Mortierella sp. AD094]
MSLFSDPTFHEGLQNDPAIPFVSPSSALELHPMVITIMEVLRTIDVATTQEGVEYSPQPQPPPSQIQPQSQIQQQPQIQPQIQPQAQMHQPEIPHTQIESTFTQNSGSSQSFNNSANQNFP